MFSLYFIYFLYLSHIMFSLALLFVLVLCLLLRLHCVILYSLLCLGVMNTISYNLEETQED